MCAAHRPQRCRQRRPAVPVAAALAAGIVVADAVAPPPWVWALVAGPALVLGAVCLGRGRSGPVTAALLALVAAAGGLRYHQHTRVSPPDHVRYLQTWGARGVLVGRIVGEPERRAGADGAAEERRTRVLLAAEAWQPEDGQARRLRGAVLVTLRGTPLPADAGDRLWLRLRLRRPAPARNPGGFDHRRFLWLQGIHAVASLYRAEDILRVEPLPAAWWREHGVGPLRRAVRGALRANLAGPTAGLLQGMLLGEKHAIPDEVAARFRSTGLAHALVISGLHVGLVALFFFTGFRVLRCPSAWACVATTAALALYAVVTDLQAPVVRATTMAAVVLLGRAAGRRGDVYNSLGLAALLLMAWQPTSPLTLSFQLSFGASLAIVGLHGPLLRWLPARWRDEGTFAGRWLVSPLCVTVAAQIGTGPLIAWHFGQFAPVSLVANLVVVPLLGVAVGVGLLTALTGPWWPALGTLFNGANALAVAGLVGTVERFTRVPYASLTTPKPGWPFMLAAALAAVLLAHGHRRRARVGLLLVVLAWGDVAVWSHVLRAGDLEVVFLDVGQGDGAFLRFPNGRTMVIDAGPRSRRFDTGARVVVPFLRHRGVGRVDVVLASHPHADHIGGLVALLEAVGVSHYVDAGPRPDTWTARRLRALIEARGIAYHRVEAGDRLAGLGGVDALVLHPGPAFLDTAGASLHGVNNGSVVVRFAYGGTRLLFTGDVERETDGALRAWGPRLRAEVLKMPHHGSSTSSTPAFLDAVHPVAAVMSLGAFNKFGHPSPEVLARLAARGVRTWRTDACGAVSLHVDGAGRRRWTAMLGSSCAEPRTEPGAGPAARR